MSSFYGGWYSVHHVHAVSFVYSLAVKEMETIYAVTHSEAYRPKNGMAVDCTRQGTRDYV